MGWVGIGGYEWYFDVGNWVIFSGISIIPIIFIIYFLEILGEVSRNISFIEKCYGVVSGLGD